ncbi:aminopeptidase [Desulfonatronovibrio hydrogenovorans]|uniref:aminopeptidase n=1 Tax=Desulfonatronovibrio hydrogenovorans TaxID=53245 RepID=UPI00048A68AB|nr:aminopeptidase [Desulfonatronovibrio hydrogenovorans]
MFTTEELDRYAQVMIWGMKKARKNPFVKDNIVLIRTDKACLPLADEIYRQLLIMELNPVVRINLPEDLEKTFFTSAQDHQLEFRIPGDAELYSSLNGLISLLGPESLTHLKDVDPSRIGKYAVTKKYLRDILEDRENKGEFGWSLCLYPTGELASKAGMEIDEYKRQIIKAAYLDQADPGALWQSIFETSKKVKTWLNQMDVEYFHVVSENTDLKVFPGLKRKWLGVSGHNIPSFEIFLSPDYRRTQGVFYADQPSYRSGNLVRGVRLEFQDGKVVKAEAEEGQEFLLKQVALDEGASFLGEFSLTDKRFSRIDKFMAHTLFDENFGGPNGNCHVALGASYSDTFSDDPDTLTKELKKELGFNDSALHWDLVNTEKKTVRAHLKNKDVITIYDDGMFTMGGL